MNQNEFIITKLIITYIPIFISYDKSLLFYITSLLQKIKFKKLLQVFATYNVEKSCPYTLQRINM